MAGVNLSDTPSSTPPLYTLYSYMYFFTQEGGMGGMERKREKVRVATVHKAGSKIPTWMTVSPVYKL